jgi:LacI family transcriptional regulator
MTLVKSITPKPRAMTIKDVAREARVSVASVSRVMNGHDNVQPETRDRILEVIKRLRYTPHLGARELITKRTHVIGVLLPDLHGEFFSELIRGIDTAAREHKQHLLLSSAHSDAAEMVTAIQAMRGRVEGLLIMAPHLDTSLLSEQLDASIPMVFMNSRVEAGRASLSIDNYQGARAMVRHLRSCGHRSIWPDPSTTSILTSACAGIATSWRRRCREQPRWSSLAISPRPRALLPGAR